MKGLTIEEKAQRYDEAIEKAKIWQNHLFECGDKDYAEELNYILPELKESDDERIRKAIILFFEIQDDNTTYSLIPKKDILAWLEKQGEQKSTDKVLKIRQEVYQSGYNDGYKHGIEDAKQVKKPQGKSALESAKEEKDDNQNCVKPTDNIESKFKEGDWIISNNKKSIYQVIEVKRGVYVICDNADNHEYHISIEGCEKSGRLWTIEDAKDGDVLYDGNSTFIFNMIRGEWINSHCSWHRDDSFYDKDEDLMTMKYATEVHPATKEQRDILFQKMKEAGYEFDIEKKELKEIK